MEDVKIDEEEVLAPAADTESEATPAPVSEEGETQEGDNEDNGDKAGA